MAIQLPNPGLGDGQTGDNEFVMWTKVKNNFSINSHAASRLVGDANGNVPEVNGDRGLNGSGIGGTSPVIINHDDIVAKTGVYRTAGSSENIHPSKPFTAWSTVFRCWQQASTFTDISFTAALNTPRIALQNVNITGDGSVTRQDWIEFYTTSNTNKGTNGALSAKSPVTHLYQDRVKHTGNDKELEPIEFVKSGVGDYLLKNTTGLAQEGWYIVIPQDANGNPLIAVEYVDNDGDISVKTYKRKFDYEQAKIVPDLEQPLDIPEGRWIDLRFNDLPIEDEPMPQEV